MRYSIWCILLLCSFLFFIGIYSDVKGEAVFFEQDEELTGVVNKISAAEEKADWPVVIPLMCRLLNDSEKLYFLCKADERRYISVADYIAYKMAIWPDDVREKIISTVKDKVDVLAKKAKSISDWENIARVYSFCQPGMKAHFRLVEIYIEKGELARALFWQERMAKLYKLSCDKYPQIFSMLALSRAGTGDFDGANEIINELSKLGNIKVKSEDQEWDVASITANVKKAIELMANKAVKINDVKDGLYLIPQKKVLNIKVPAYYWLDSVPDIYMQFGDRPVIEQKASIIGDKLFLSNSKALRSYDLKDGKLLWFFGLRENTPPQMSIDGRGKFLRPRSPEGTMDILRVDDKFIVNLGDKMSGLGDMRQRRGGMVPNPKSMPIINTVLNSVDMSGKEVWEAFADKEDKQFLYNLIFLNIPVRVRDKLYVAGVAAKEDPEMFLVCIDSNNGKLLWKKFLWAFVSDGNDGVKFHGRGFARMLQARGRSSISPKIGDDPAMAADNNHVYVSSRFSCIAAFDIEDGSPVWLYNYDWKPAPATIGYRNHNRGWLINTPLVWKSLLLAAPSNAVELFALDKLTGKKVWAYPRGNHNYLLGVHNDNVFISGDKITSIEAATGKETWSKDVGAKPFGRGCLYNGIIYHPTEKGLFLLNADDGAIVHKVDWNNPFEQAGNIIITGGKLVICGYNNVYVYESEEKKIDAKK